MASTKQKLASMNNIKKAHAKWHNLSSSERAIAHLNGRARKKSSLGGGKLSRIAASPKREFISLKKLKIDKKII